MGKQAIDAPRSNLFLVEPEDLTIVGLDTDDGPEHPLYDQRVKLPLDMNMARNIAVHGVIQAINVRKDGDDVQVVEGRQRVRAAREANKILAKEGKETIRVPVKLERGQDHTMFGIMVSANEHRHDDSTIAKAHKLARYLAMGRTEEEAAVMFGVTMQTIKNWTVLLDLDSKVQKAVEDGKISAHSAAGLAKLSRPEQREKLDELLTETAKTGKKASRTKTNASTTGEAKISKRQIQKLLALISKDDEAVDILSEDFIIGVRWAIGNIPTNRISGLTQLLRKAEEMAKPKKTSKPKEGKKPRKKKPPRP